MRIYSSSYELMSEMGRELNIFKVLADSQRRDILIMLRNERLNAGEIAGRLEEFIWERGKNHPHVKRMDVGKRVCLIK